MKPFLLYSILAFQIIPSFVFCRPTKVQNGRLWANQSVRVSSFGRGEVQYVKSIPPLLRLSCALNKCVRSPDTVGGINSRLHYFFGYSTVVSTGTSRDSKYNTVVELLTTGYSIVDPLDISSNVVEVPVEIDRRFFSRRRSSLWRKKY